MTCRWTLIQATFTPAEVAQITGVHVGTQRQWWSRGFLGERTAGRARVTLREVASILALRECAELKITLERVSDALPALSRAAVHYIALNSMPWPFKGTAQQSEKFKAWAAAEDMRGDQYLLLLLGMKRGEISRYVVIKKAGVGHLNDLANLNDDNDAAAVVILDSWGIAERMREKVTGSVFAVQVSAKPMKLV